MQFHHHYRSGRFRFKFRVILTSYFMFFLAALLILSGILILFKVSPTNTPSFPVSLDYALSFLQTLEFRRFRILVSYLDIMFLFVISPKVGFSYDFVTVIKSFCLPVQTLYYRSFCLQVDQYIRNKSSDIKDVIPFASKKRDNLFFPRGLVNDSHSF